MSDIPESGHEGAKPDTTKPGSRWRWLWLLLASTWFSPVSCTFFSVVSGKALMPVTREAEFKTQASEGRVPGMFFIAVQKGPNEADFAIVEADRSYLSQLTEPYLKMKKNWGVVPGEKGDSSFRVLSSDQGWQLIEVEYVGTSWRTTTRYRTDGVKFEPVYRSQFDIGVAFWALIIGVVGASALQMQAKFQIKKASLTTSSAETDHSAGALLESQPTVPGSPLMPTVEIPEGSSSSAMRFRWLWLVLSSVWFLPVSCVSTQFALGNLCKTQPTAERP